MWLSGYQRMGVYKVPCNLIFFPTLVLNFLIFFPKISVPFSFSPLDNLPYSLNIIEQMILLPLTLFSTWFSSKKPLKLPSPLNNLKFFPKRFDKFPPPQGWGMRNFIHPCQKMLSVQCPIPSSSLTFCYFRKNKDWLIDWS